MTFSLTATQAWLAFMVACLTIVAHVASTMWIGIQARKLRAELHDREAVRKRALELIRQLADERRKGPVKIQGNGWYAPAGVAPFRVGEDPLRDRAIMLAQEWRAIKVRWHLDDQILYVRTVNDPDQK